MASVHFITGGERSGKSRYAQQLALSWAANPVYVATSRVWDEDHQQRIERHKTERGPEWRNLEEEKALDRLSLDNQVVVVDCVTLWLSNFFADTHQDVESSLQQAREVFGKLMQKSCTLIIISNEIGMGVHAATKAGRRFTELQGWMNQHIAERADEVTLMVSGIPVTIKA